MSWNHFRNFFTPKNALLSGANSPNLNSIERFRRTMPPTAAWPGETILRVAPPRKTRPPDHTRVNWPVDASASGSAQVGSGGRHRWAARVQVGREPTSQKAREGYPSHYTSLGWCTRTHGHTRRLASDKNECVQERCNSIANTLELRLSCINASIWTRNPVDGSTKCCAPQD